MKIGYKTLHGTAEWVVKEAGEEGMLHLEFEPKCNGVITLANTSFRVKNGCASLPLCALPNGVYHPKLESDTGVFVAEGFYKEGDKVTMLKTEESVIRRLVKRCHTLESKNTALEERVAHLEALCQGHTIFDYERMEK